MDYAMVSNNSAPPRISFNLGVPEPNTGHIPLLSGRVTAPAGLSSLELYEGTLDLGSAKVKDNGSWTFLFEDGAGVHTDIHAVATDTLGQQTSAPSHYDLTTGIMGQPYDFVEDLYDPSTGGLLMQIFMKKDVVYLKDDVSTTTSGSIAYNYYDGSYFHGKSYSSFIDTYGSPGQLETHVENNKDGSHHIEIDSKRQSVRALGADTFVDNTNRTRFIFHLGAGDELINGFQAAGSGHDIVSLPNSESTRLAQILAHATDDGQGDATLHLGKGDTITFMGVSVAALQKHQGDVVFRA